MSWTFETAGELGTYIDADSDGNLTSSGTVASSKSKSIKNVKAPSNNEDSSNWETLFNSLCELFDINGEITYFRGKAVLE